MLNPTSNPLTILMPPPSSLLCPNHTDNRSRSIPNTLNLIPDIPIQVGPRSPSSDPHTPSPSNYIFSLTLPTKVPGPSTNCLCCPTPNTTLYLRDQYVPETWMPKSTRPTTGELFHLASLAGTPHALPLPSLLGPCKATPLRPPLFPIHAPRPPRGSCRSPEARLSPTPWPKPSPEKQRRGWQQKVARSDGNGNAKFNHAMS